MIDNIIEECQAKLSHAKQSKPGKKPKMLQFCTTVGWLLSNPLSPPLYRLVKMFRAFLGDPPDLKNGKSS
jgi:hypothetical protein